jgi:cytochrome c553
VFAALILTACEDESQSTQLSVDVDAGRNLVQAECSNCHGLDGAGRTSEIPNLAAQPAEYLVEAMHAYREGARHHAALQDLFAGLDESQIRNIAAYFAAQPPVAIEPGSSRIDEAYREGAEFADACVECHGERGFSTTPGVPSLAGQQPAYLIVATQEYADGSRGHVEKQAMLRELDRVDIEKMAMYFAAQAPSPRGAPPFGDPDRGEALSAGCGECHGARGVSHDPLIPSLAGQEPTYLLNAITAYRDHERSHEDMVADRTDAEIEHIAAFYAVQPAGSMTDAGEALESVVAKCERCHGRSAAGSTLVVPALRGQKPDYLLKVMQEYRDEERGSSMMHKMSSSYSDELLRQLANWYASHPAEEN